MTDGILDLLTAVLVLGVVVAICFGFILPLTDSDYMDFDSQYQDKGAMSATIDYAASDSEDTAFTHRMYTYEELLLLLSVQDSRMEEPKSVNIRNLMTSVDLSYSGYSTKYQGTGKNNALKNINNLSLTLDDEAQHAMLRYAENCLISAGADERGRLKGSSSLVTEPNVGNIIISDTFDLTKDPFISELNGAERVNVQAGEDVAGYRYTDSYRLSTAASVTEPDPDGDKTYANRIFYISHHFAIPDDSNYMSAGFKRSDDEKATFFVEIEGPFMRDGVRKVIDTYAEYQEYLTLYRATIKGNK